VDTANEEIKIKKKEAKPEQMILEALESLKAFRDEQNEVTTRLEVLLKEAIQIIERLLRSKK